MDIIALCGKKQSGKTTLSNFLHGHEMKLHDVIQDFNINEFGNLVVNYVQLDENGKEHEGTAVFDLWQQTDDFVNYAQRFIWPLIKGYNFADPLKEICINLFGLSYEQCYGQDSWKNSPTNINWEDMPGVSDVSVFSHGYMDAGCEAFGVTHHKPGPMTAREFMQFFGTEIMRKMKEDVWVSNCLNRIKYDNAPIAIISDCRYINEIEAVKRAGGKVIKLTREPIKSSHSSETEAENYDDFDAVIDNTNMSIKQSCDAFLNILVDWGVTKKIRMVNPRMGMASIK